MRLKKLVGQHGMESEASPARRGEPESIFEAEKQIFAELSQQRSFAPSDRQPFSPGEESDRPLNPIGDDLS
jgi:hypothetical protein